MFQRSVGWSIPRAWVSRSHPCQPLSEGWRCWELSAYQGPSFHLWATLTREKERGGRGEQQLRVRGSGPSSPTSRPGS